MIKNLFFVFMHLGELVVAWIRRIKLLWGMPQYTFVEFNDLLNIHIFKNIQSEKSCCGGINKKDHNIISQEKELSHGNALKKAYELQIKNKDVCGQCVATLYNANDVTIFHIINEMEKEAKAAIEEEKVINRIVEKVLERLKHE